MPPGAPVTHLADPARPVATVLHPAVPPPPGAPPADRTAGGGGRPPGPPRRACKRAARAAPTHSLHAPRTRQRADLQLSVPPADGEVRARERGKRIAAVGEGDIHQAIESPIHRLLGSRPARGDGDRHPPRHVLDQLALLRAQIKALLCPDPLLPRPVLVAGHPHTLEVGTEVLGVEGREQDEAVDVRTKEVLDLVRSGH
mmetsp:Transcript_42799/g.107128  ORF Transcript_42799/g.107128 Transcript_42799/m.107128 type:complete len:200 (-) Transcript_42799:715-1314(-)